MKGLILCAGKGKRLRPLTWFTPKPMIRVGGKPVLEHLVDHLNRFGVRDIVVNLHYQPLKIMKHFGVRLKYTYEPILLGEELTVGSLKDWIAGEFLVVVNGDTLTNLNITRMFRLGGGRNVRFVDKGIYAGVKILGPNYYYGDRTMLDYYDTDAYWMDIGTFEGLKKARELFKNK